MEPAPHLAAAGEIALPLAQMMGGGDMGWGILMMAVMLLVSILVVVGVILLVRSLLGERPRRDGGQDERPDSLEILKRRFAEGEIETDEYRERRATLERGT